MKFSGQTRTLLRNLISNFAWPALFFQRIRIHKSWGHLTSIKANPLNSHFWPNWDQIWKDLCKSTHLVKKLPQKDKWPLRYRHNIAKWRLLIISGPSWLLISTKTSPSGRFLYTLYRSLVFEVLWPQLRPIWIWWQNRGYSKDYGLFNISGLCWPIKTKTSPTQCCLAGALFIMI